VACPSGCSEHGTCEYVGGSSWDAAKTRACKCDPGFGGIDCSSPLCPLGDDPMTVLADPTQVQTTDIQVYETQNVTVASKGAPMNSGNVTFTYTDLYGGSWTTRPVLLPVAKAYVNTHTLYSGTAAETGSTTAIHLSTLSQDDAVTAGAQAGTLVSGGTGANAGFFTSDANDYNGYVGLSGFSTTTSGTNERWVVKGFANAKLAITPSTAIVSSTTSTQWKLFGGKKANPPNWKKLGKEYTYGTAMHLKNIGTTAVDGKYKHYFGAVATGEAQSPTTFSLRKGDWIFVGPDVAVTTVTGGGCLMQVAEDYLSGGEDGALYTVADETTAPCLYAPGTPSVTTSAVHVLWYKFAIETVDYDGVSKTVTKFNADTGTLTIDAAGAAGHVYRALMPGMWIRLYYANSPTRGYCDMQLNHFTRTTAAEQMDDDATTLYVDPASLTSSHDDQSLCQSFSYLSAEIGSPTYRHPNSNVGIAYLPNAQVVEDGTAYGATGGNVETYAVATSGTVATITQSAAFNIEDASALVVGATVMLMRDDTAADPFYCACTLNASPVVGTTTAAITCTAPPTIAGVAPTSCVGKTLAATADYRLIAFAMNGIYYAQGAGDSTNSKKFEDIAVGDTVRVSNPFESTTATQKHSNSATLEVETKDPATSAATSLFFKMGSKPNGGGMYAPVGIVAPVAFADANTDTGMMEAKLSTSVWLHSTAVMQPVYSASASWVSTDAACTQSAKDVKRVLEELPNRVVDEVTVSMTSNTMGLYAYTIAFAGARNTGNQNDIIMNSKGCNMDVCQPRYSGVAVQRAFVADDIAVAAGAVTSTDQADLSSVVAAAGGETLLFYQQGAASGTTSPNMYASATQIYTDGLSTAAAAEPTSLMVLKNVGDTNTDTNEKYFESKTYEITRGTNEAIECSGRGACSDDGTCECFDGYKGDACHIQSSLV
jgi:hypothetical protein